MDRNVEGIKGLYEDSDLPGVFWNADDKDRISLAYDPARRRGQSDGEAEILVMPIDEAKTLFRSLGITLGIAGHEVPDIPSTLYSPEGQPIGG